MKTAEDYWYEFSNHSTGAITEAQFKAAIRRCQQDHDKIKKLEFELKQERNKAIDECIDIVKYSNHWTACIQKLESLKH